MEIKNNTAASEKKLIRSAVLKKRNAMSVEERSIGSENVFQKIIRDRMYTGSDTILCFASYGSEIDTFHIIEESLSLGKRVYVPKVVSEESGSMCFYRLMSISELLEGYKGIPEPCCTEHELVSDGYLPEKTMMIMPGAVFDRSNHRLGYGKGFYDRFLSNHFDLIERTAAIGFACQLLDDVPYESTDICPNQIIISD